MKRRHFIQNAALGLAASALAGDAPRIRIAQIGTAHSHAAGKMAAIRSLPEIFEIAGIAENDDARRTRAKLTPAYLGLRWLSEEELLADETIRAVVIETTLEDSTRAAHAAIRAGRHVHLDKPGGADHAAFKAMRSDAAARGLTVQMGFMLRYNPAFEMLFRAVREGWLGDVLEVDASMGKLADPRLRAAQLAHPGHGMFELACHITDAALTVLGPPVAVHSFGKATRAPGDTLPDNQLAVLEYPKATATLRCNHADPFGGPHRRFAVRGTAGAIEIQPLESGKGVIRLNEARGGHPRGESQFALKVPPDRYAGEFRDLAAVIRGEKKLAWSAEHDIATHATALRAAGINP